jgi:transposase-like protein
MAFPKKTEARRAFAQALSEGASLKEAAKAAGVPHATARRWAKEAAASGSSRVAPTSPSSSTPPVSPSATSRPEIPPRLPDLDAARKAAGLNGHATAPGPSTGTGPAPMPVTAETVLDLADGALSFGVSIVAGLSGAPFDDGRVQGLAKLSARERGILAPMAPSVARRLPAILDAVDRFVPYAFALTLCFVTVSHCRVVNAIGKEVSAAKKKAREEAKAQAHKEESKG